MAAGRWFPKYESLGVVGLVATFALVGCGGPGTFPQTKSTVLPNGLTLTLAANRTSTTTGNVIFTESYTNLTSSPIETTVIGANVDPPHSLYMDVMLTSTETKEASVTSRDSIFTYPPPVYTGIIQPGESLSGTATYTFPPGKFQVQAIYYTGTSYPYQETLYDAITIDSIGDADNTDPS